MRRRIKDKKELDVEWVKVSSAFQAIFARKMSTLSYQDLFDVYRIIVISKQGQHVEQKLKEEFHRIVSQIITILKLEKNDLIKQFCYLFKQYKNLIDKITKTAVYYDTKYVLKNEKVSPVPLLGHIEIKARFLESGMIQSVVNYLLEQIKGMRMGEYQFKLLLREAIHYFIDLGTDDVMYSRSIMGDKTYELKISKSFYTQEFEPYFLKESRKSYQNEVLKADFTSQTGLLDMITQIFVDEIELSKAILHFSTKEKVIECLDEVLVRQFSKELLSHLPEFIQENNQPELYKLIKLFLYSHESKINLHLKLKEVIHDTLTEINKLKSEKESIKKLLEFRVKLHWLLTIQNFQGSKNIIKYVDDQFRHFIISQKLEKNIAKFIHLFILKTKTASEEEFEEFYSDIKDILVLIQERTLFIVHYLKYLHKRLLNYDDASTNIYETKILNILKFQGLREFSVKAEIPINDIRDSFRMNNKFHANLSQIDAPEQYNTLLAVDFNFKVLTSDFWSFSRKNAVRVPLVVNIMQRKFEKFFHTQFKQRKIEWINEEGKSAIWFKIPGQPRKKELNLTNIQACVCLLFNKKTSFTFDKFKQELRIKHEDNSLLETELKGLLYTKILTSTGKEKVKDKLKATSVFTVNTNFTSRRILIRVKAFKEAKKYQEEEQRAEEKYLITKKIKIQSSVMKVIKAEKTLKFDILYKKTVLLLSEFFSPQRREIMKAIENLINKEFIKRDENDPNLIHYT